MNYSGKFDATISDALGKHPSGHLFSETVHASHAPSDAIVVPDAQLLFGGEFKRTGVDLVLSGDGRELVLHDYFKGEKHAPLASPDGAHLTGDLVDALSGQVQYAQAGGNAAAGQVIGHVTKLTGTATAIRNGVSIILNNGDNVEKGDVVASGSDSTVGITFIDGTVFGLSSNARMVLNEMVYDPNGSNNSSLLSLVAGTITFVAGETAKHGDMKVDTPVATMGIRGTAVLVEIDFSVPGATPDAKFQVLVEPDGTTGSYILFDKTTLTPLAVVDKAGMQINVSNGVMSQTLAPLSPEIQKLITDVFSLKFSDSTNTKSIEHFTDSIVPNAFGPVNFALVNGNLLTFAAPPPPPAGAGAPAAAANNGGHIGEPPQINTADPGTITELPHVTNNTAVDKVTGQIQYYDVNVTDHDTVSVKFSSFTYQDAKGHDVTGSLTSLQLADIAKVEAAVTVSGNTGPNTGGFGSATWNYSVTDKAFDFLAAGETLTLTYTATVDNNYQPLDQTGSQTITITITGTNDVPVITSPQQNVSFAASGTDTKGGDLIPNTVTHGTLAFTDPDLTDTHTVAVNMTSALLDGQPLSATAGQTVINELAAAVTASIAKGDDSTGSGAGTIDWTLANLQVYLADLVPAGESLVLTYAVTVTDSQGATSVQDIVVTIGGNNEAAVVWTNTNPIPPGGVAQWSDAANWEGDRAPSTQGTDDVFIGTDQLQPGTPVFPATVTDAEAAKSLTMDYFTDFGASIPELDILSTGTLTIAGALKMDTSTDSGSPLTAESIIKNFGTLSVGGIATLLKNSVLDNYGTVTLAQGGVFGDQSSITNSGTIEIVSDTLDVQVGIADAGGLLQVDGGATLKLSDGATITKGEVTLGSLSTLDVEVGAVSLPAGTPDATLDGVSVIGMSGLAPSTIQIGTGGAATLLLDDGTSIENGNLTISGGSALDVTTSGAALDGVTVTGTNATLSVAASTIEVGTTTTTGTVLTLDDGTTITNGNLIIDAGNTLDIESAGGATLDGVNVTNSGTIQVDSQLVLDGVTINGGTIDDTGTLSVSASSEIENATVNGGGDITVTGGTLTLSEVTLDDVTLAGSFTNSDKLTIKDTVTLNGATINGGSIDDIGTLSVSTASTIENATVDGGGNLTATSAPLTLSGVTLDDVSLTGLFTNSGTLTIDDTVTLTGVIDGGTIDDIGTLLVTSGVIEGTTVDGGGNLTSTGAGASLAGVTLDDVTVAGIFTSASTLKIDETVTLKGATIDGGTIDDTGTLSVSTASTIENAIVNGGGNLTATSATLTLSGVLLENLTLAGSFTNSNTLVTEGTVTLNGATISGGEIEDPGTLSVSASSEIENATVDGGGDLTVTGGTLTLSEVTLDSVTLAGSFTNSDTLTIDHTVTLNGATLDGGTIDDTGTLSVIDSSEIENATVNGGGDLTVTGGTLTLSKVTLDDVTLAGSFTNSDTLTTKDTVTLKGATLNGGTIDDTGTLSVSASSEIENATVDGGGDLTVTGGTLTLSEVTLDSVTLSGSFTNSDTLTVKDTVTLNGATINGGTIDDVGTLSVSASSEIENATVDGTGDLTVTGGTLTLSKVTLDDVTLAGSFTNSDTLTTKDTVTLKGATLNGGTIDDTGAISVTASSEIENATVNGGGDLTVTGGTLTLSEVTLDDVTLAGSFTNSDTLTTKDTVTLDGATINGGTIEDTGTLSVSASSEIENATVNGGGDLTVTGGTLTLSEVTLDDVTLAGSFTNSDTLTIDHTVTLKGATLDGGTIGDIGTLSVLASSEIENATVNDGGDLTVTGGTLTLSEVTLDDVTLSGSFTNSDTLTIDDTVTLNGATITGGTIDDTGTLSVSASSEIENATVNGGGDLTVTGGTLTLSEVTLDNVTLSGSVTNSDTLTIDGTVTLKGVTLNGGTIDDTGTLSVLASSEIENATVNDGGDLTVTGGTLTLSEVTLDDVTLSGSFTNSDTLTIDGTVTLKGATLDGGTIDDTGTLSVIASSEIENATVDGTGDLTVTTGMLTLSEVTLDGVTLAGSFTNSDMLTIDHTVTLNGATINGGTIDDTGTLSVSASSEIENATVDGGGDLTVTGGTLTLSEVTLDNVTLSGSVTNSDTLTIDGTVTLKGATINGGTIDDTGTLSVSASSEIENATVNGGGDLTVTGGTLTLSEVTLDNVTLAGSFTNSDTLTIDDTVTLKGATLNGGTIDDTGTLSVSASSEIENATVNGGGDLTVTSGTLTLSEVALDDVTLAGSFTNSDTLTIDHTVTLNGATINGGTIDDTGTITGYGVISSVIAGLGALTASGGTLTLSGLNTYSGVTTIDSGAVLAAGVADAFSASSAVTDNGELDLGTTDQTIASLNGTNSAALVGSFSGTGTSPAVLTINNGGSFAGVVEDGSAGAATALTLAGGTLTLTGDNLYTGVTTISGTLVLSGSGSIADSSDVVDDGTFDIQATAGTSIVTLSGTGTVDLGAATLTLSNASTEFDGVIEGSGGLTLTTGTEILGGTNTYTGVTTIDGGSKLTLSSTGSIADSSDVIDDGTFDIQATAGTSIVTLSGTGTVDLGAATLTLSNASTEFDGVIEGSGGLTLTTGTETLGGTNTYTGVTTIDGSSKLTLSGLGSIAGSSDVDDDGTFDISATTSGASIVTLSGDGTVALGSKKLTLTNASTTFSGTIGGTGGLALLAGMLTLTGDSSYSGTTTISGTLALSGSGSIANSSDVIDNGTFDVVATTSGASIVTLSGDGAVKLGSETLTLTKANTIFSGVISGSGGLTVDGTGTETLSGINTFGGATTIGSGETLALSGTGSIAGSSDVVDNGTFDISGTTSGASIVTLSGNGTIKLGAETLTLSDASTTFSGTIGGTGGLTLTAGTETLTGNNTYSGVTTINGGTLALSGSGSIANSSDVIDDGTFDISATTSGASIVTLSGDGAVKLGSVTLTLSKANTIFSGVISGSGGLTVDGTGTETLSGINTFGGATNIGSGETLALSGSGSIAHSSDVIDGGTFDISATTSGASIVTLSGNGTIKLGAETLTLSDASTTFSGTIGGTGGLTLTAGTETLTGNNTYSGVTTINGGTLALSGSGSIAHSSDVIDGGTFDISATTSGASIVTLSGDGAVTLGAETLTLSNASTTFSGTISSTGGGITVASGTLTLGTMTLDDLTLAGSFSNSGTLTIDDTVTLNGATISGGTLDISGILDSTGTDVISGATIVNSDHIDVVSGTLTIDPTPFTNNGTFEVQGSAVFSGEVHTLPHNVVQIDQEVVTNTNGTIKIDAGGTLTLFDTTINGGTIIDNGTLLLTGTTSKLENVTFSGAATLDIASGATLELGGSGYSGVTVKFDQANGAGLLVLDDSHHFNGTISGLVEADPESAENHVDLTDLTYTANKMSFSFNSTTDMLTITNNSSHAHPDSVSLHIATGSNFSAEFEIHSDTTIGGSGGTLLDDPSATGVNTIDSGDVLGILAASSATINFTNTAGTTGELLLADSKDFSGTIAGFTGDGTVANSDLIDVTDVQIADVALNKTTYTDHGNGTGTLTLYNASGQALDSINFDGNYQLANFTIENDGDGGTLIVDPPVNTSVQAPANTTVASKEHSTGTAGPDGFVFNFDGHHHAPTTDFHPDLENFQPGGSMLTNLHTGSNVPPDQGTSAGGDGHDHIGLSPFAKAHLHAADFHFV